MSYSKSIFLILCGVLLGPVFNLYRDLKPEHETKLRNVFHKLKLDIDYIDILKQLRHEKVDYYRRLNETT